MRDLRLDTTHVLFHLYNVLARNHQLSGTAGTLPFPFCPALCHLCHRFL